MTCSRSRSRFAASRAHKTAIASRYPIARLFCPGASHRASPHPRRSHRSNWSASSRPERGPSASPNAGSSSASPQNLPPSDSKYSRGLGTDPEGQSQWPVVGPSDKSLVDPCAFLCELAALIQLRPQAYRIHEEMKRGHRGS